jgi:hypothetical protein
MVHVLKHTWRENKEPNTNQQLRRTAVSRRSVLRLNMLHNNNTIQTPHDSCHRSPSNRCRSTR